MLERATVLAKAKVRVAGAMSTATGRAMRLHFWLLLFLPPPPPMTPAEIMAELLAAHRESAAARQETARAMDIMAQAIAGLARGGHRGNGGNGGGARGPEGSCSY